MNDALGSFLEWCDVKTYNVDQAWRDPDLMNNILAHYTQYCKNSGQWDAISIWQFQLPSRNRAPIPADIVENMALVLVRRASSRPREAAILWAAAILIRLGFYGLFRPGELFTVTVGDLSF